MKIKNISLILSASAPTGCGIYQKYDPEKINSRLVSEYAEALKQEEDAGSFGNLAWEKVFTDPMLADLINQALANNKDLRNAKLNVDMAMRSSKVRN